MARGRRTDRPDPRVCALDTALLDAPHTVLYLNAAQVQAAQGLLGGSRLDSDYEVVSLRRRLDGAEHGDAGDALVELPLPLAARLLDMADGASKRDGDRGAFLLARAILACLP